jgi:sugar phosphate isomerase/epimerase
MTFGWCGRIDQADRVRDLGLDYLEVGLGPLGIEDDECFRRAKAVVANASLPTPVFNQFLPQGMHVVGPSVDRARIRQYLARAAEVLRAARAETVVFGSGWARNVPEGWSRQRADGQFLDMIGWCTDALDGSGVRLALESQNVKETNLLTTVVETAALSRAINRPGVRIIADTYHLHVMSEGLDVVALASDQIVHVHVSDSDRALPGEGTYDFTGFFDTLKRHGYEERLSIEMMRPVTDDEIARSASFVRDVWSRVG